jgi:hypothetical protein
MPCWSVAEKSKSTWMLVRTSKERLVPLQLFSILVARYGPTKNCIRGKEELYIGPIPQELIWGEKNSSGANPTVVIYDATSS